MMSQPFENGQLLSSILLYMNCNICKGYDEGSFKMGFVTRKFTIWAMDMKRLVRVRECVCTFV